MEIRVSLNTTAVDVVDLRAQLDAELHALDEPGVQIRTQKSEVAAGTLALVEAYQFILQYRQEIIATVPLLTAVLQLSNAILQRRGHKPEPKPAKGAKGSRSPAKVKHSTPLVIVSLDDREIQLPAEDRQLKEFIDSVQRSSKKGLGDPPRSSHKSAKKKPRVK